MVNASAAVDVDIPLENSYRAGYGEGFNAGWSQGVELLSALILFAFVAMLAQILVSRAIKEELWRPDLLERVEHVLFTAQFFIISLLLVSLFHPFFEVVP